MPQHLGISKQIAFVLAERDTTSAPTLGDLCDILGLRTGHAIGERLREARGRYGFKIEHITVRRGDAIEHRYVMPEGERERVRAMAEFQEWRDTRGLYRALGIGA